MSDDANSEGGWDENDGRRGVHRIEFQGIDESNATNAATGIRRRQGKEFDYHAGEFAWDGRENKGAWISTSANGERKPGFGVGLRGGWKWLIVGRRLSGDAEKGDQSGDGGSRGILRDVRTGN